MIVPGAGAGGHGGGARRRGARGGRSGSGTPARRRAAARALVGGGLHRSSTPRPASTCGRPAARTAGRRWTGWPSAASWSRPGAFYGPAGQRHVRVALTATDERVAAAAQRLAQGPDIEQGGELGAHGAGMLGTGLIGWVRCAAGCTTPGSTPPGSDPDPAIRGGVRRRGVGGGGEWPTRSRTQWPARTWCPLRPAATLPATLTSCHHRHRRQLHGSPTSAAFRGQGEHHRGHRARGPGAGSCPATRCARGRPAGPDAAATDLLVERHLVLYREPTSPTPSGRSPRCSSKSSHRGWCRCPPRSTRGSSSTRSARSICSAGALAGRMHRSRCGTQVLTLAAGALSDGTRSPAGRPNRTTNMLLGEPDSRRSRRWTRWGLGESGSTRRCAPATGRHAGRPGSPEGGSRPGPRWGGRKRVHRAQEALAAEGATSGELVTPAGSSARGRAT